MRRTDHNYANSGERSLSC